MGKLSFKPEVIELTYGETAAKSIRFYDDGVPLSLTSETVTLTAVWVGEHLGRNFSQETPTSYDPGATVAIEDFAFSNDGDQSANPGLGTFTPTSAMYTGAPPGTYWPQFRLVNGSTVRFIPRDPTDRRYRLIIHEALRSLND